MQIQQPRQGYKIVKTIFGKYQEIPLDWNISRVKNHIEILVGHSFPSSEYSDNPNDIKLIRGDNVTEGRLRWEDKTRYWKSSSGLEKYLLHEGDFVISMDGSKVGKNYAYITKNDVPSLLLQRVARLRTKETLTQKYFGYIFGNQNFVNYVNSIKTNAAIPHISQSQIENFEFILPPKTEQEKIASILSNVDSLIYQTQKIIEQTQRLKNGLMQKLLTKGIGHTKFKKIKLGFRFIQTEIPETWNVLSLKDLSQDGLMNGIFKKPNEFGSGVPLVNVTDLFSDDDVALKKLEKVKVTEKELERFGIKSGDIFFCRSSLVRGGIGRSNIILNLTEPAVFECHVMMLRPNNLIHPKFLFYFTRSDLFKKYLYSIAMTLTMTTIRQPDLESVFIPIPSFEEQSKIISVLSDIDSRIMELQNEKDNLETLKKGLMQKLLTGQIRVKV